MWQHEQQDRAGFLLTEELPVRVAWAIALLLFLTLPALAQQTTLKCVVEAGNSAYTVYGTSPGPPDRICDVGCTVTTSDGGTRSANCSGVGLNAGWSNVPLCGEGPPGAGAPYSNPILSSSSSCRPP